MSTTQVVTVAASLTAGHPFGQILVQRLQADVSDSVATAAAGASGALLLAGLQDFDTSQQLGGGSQGLTAAGVAAIASAYSTYVGGLSAAKKAQVGALRAIVTSSGMAVSVHVADIATFAATLQTALNTGANFGAIGS
jgi:hypothetical protein